MKETDLFEPVKRWLEDGGHEVYSEVRKSLWGGKRADIVALHGSVTTVVELKTSLSLELIQQAVEWKPHAHYIYVAIPKPKKSLNDFACRILKDYGIGVLTVDFNHDEPWVERVRYTNKPKLNRRISGYLKDALTEYHKDGPPGGHPGGGYITAYRITMLKIKEHLLFERRWHGDGWCSVQSILDHCETHYSSPKPSLSKALRDFEHEWCESKKEGRALYFRHR